MLGTMQSDYAVFFLPKNVFTLKILSVLSFTQFSELCRNTRCEFRVNSPVQLRKARTRAARGSPWSCFVS